MWSLHYQYHLKTLRPHFRPNKSEILEEEPAIWLLTCPTGQYMLVKTREPLAQNKDKPQSHPASVLYTYETLGKLPSVSKPEFTHQDNYNKTYLIGLL